METLDQIRAEAKPWAELPAPKGIDRVADLSMNRLATSQDIIDLQNEANKRLDESRAKSSWKHVTIRMALGDAKRALFGIIGDLYGNTKPAGIRDVFTKDDRLRGIGVLLVLIFGAWLLIDAVM